MAKGRGRLSTIDTLPEWADAAKFAAFAALKENKLTQLDILAQFNADLRAAGAAAGAAKIPQISKSAFGRRAMRAAIVGRRLAETREIAAALTERLGPGEADDLTDMVAETIKTLVFELLEAHGEAGLGPKGTMELARALQSAVSSQSISAERRRKMEAELKDKATAAVDAVAKAAEASGQPIDGAAMLKKIREDIYGIFER